jgi:DNA-binding HxlR family transcriptional regulator
MHCSVARTLSVIGERWTMLILREAFLGRHRFDEFQQGTGIARNILSSRLRDLVEKGVFDRARAAGEQGRVEYRLTQKGLDLYPILIALMRWGDTWLCDEAGPPMALVHRNCGAATTPEMVCSECGQPLEAREVSVIPQKIGHRARRTERSDRKRVSGANLPE